MTSATTTTLDSLVNAALPDQQVIAVPRAPTLFDMITQKIQYRPNEVHRIFPKAAALAPTAGTIAEDDAIPEQAAADGTPVTGTLGHVGANFPYTDWGRDYARAAEYIQADIMPAFMQRLDTDVLTLISGATPILNTTVMTDDVWIEGLYDYKALSPGASINFFVTRLEANEQHFKALKNSSAAVLPVTAGSLLAELGLSVVDGIMGSYMGVTILATPNLPQVDGDHWMSAFLGGTELRMAPGADGRSGLIGSPLGIVWSPRDAGGLLELETQRDAAKKRTLLVATARYQCLRLDAQRLGAVQTNKVA